MAVLGVDGARKGWIGALVDGGTVEWRWLATAAEVVEQPAEVIAIDIPMGLPAEGSARRCDQLARKRLKTAGSSVFPAPPRRLVDQPPMTYAESLGWLKEALLGGISIQTHGIIDKIRDVDSLLDRGMQDRIVEAHPELSFRELAQTDRMAGKKTARGAAQRIQALRGWLAPIDVTDLLLDVPDKVAIDDALDALACAWTAQRHANGESQALGDDEEPDAKHLLMRIVI